MNLSSPLALVLLLWINSNVLEYVCKLYLFTSMNFLIHNWYKLLLLHSQTVIYMYNTIYIFFLWMIDTFVYQSMFIQLVICSPYSSVNIVESYCTLLHTISRSHCCIETSKYLILFLLWWMHMLSLDDPCKMCLYLSMVLVLFF